MSTDLRRPKILRRARIDRLLAEMDHYPLLVVSAPMGYGKSTAVRSYLERRGVETIWIGMSYAIETGASSFFWHLLVKHLVKHRPELAGSLEKKSFPTDSIGIFNVVEELRGADWGAETVLVVDDYQFVENAQVNNFLARLAAADIPGLHLVVITRKMPDLPLVEFKMKGLCDVIKTADLAFTEEEIGAYLDEIGFTKEESVRRELIDNADGWITSAYLLANNWASGFHFAPIYSMLKHSMFEQLDRPLQELLLRLSVFDIFTVEQAAFVLQRPDVGAQLEQLYLSNAFISTIWDERFSIHQVFRNFLRKECAYHSVDLRELYRRNGEWYYQKHSYVMAYQNWLGAGAYDRILSSLEGAQNASISPADKSLMFQVFGYVDRETYCRYPLATLKYITHLAVGGYKGPAARILAELQQYYETHVHDAYDSRRLQGEFHVARTMLCLDDIEQIERELRLAREAVGEGGSLLYNRETRPPCCTPEFSYAFFSRMGAYQDTVRRLSAALRDGVALTGSGAGCPELIQAEYALETGEFERVEELARQALDIAATHEQTWVKVAAQFTLARLYILRQRMDEAQEILDSFFHLQNQDIDPGLFNQIQASIGYLYGTLGEAENIPAPFCEGDLTKYHARGMESAFAYLVCERAFLLEEEYEELERRARVFQNQYDNSRSQLGLIHHHIILAVARERLFGPERGQAELDRAMELARPDRVILPFIENARSLRRLLTPQVQNAAPEFWSKVLAFVDAAEQPQQHTVGRCGLLSAREAEIMYLMEKGKRQREIAELLYISPNTVKKHMENIYRKLNVNNKTLALKEFQKIKHPQWEG